MPEGVVTVTSTIPAAWAGLFAVIELALTTVTPVADVVPNFTAVAPVKPVPVIATEQYRKGLGATVPEVAAAIPDFAPMEKVAFSAHGAADFAAALEKNEISEPILCGMEAHVCVTQTCLDLLAQGFRVFVAADAVSSRTPDNYRYGIDRMRAAGAVIVSTEMVLFELLEQAGTDEFKQVLALVK